MTPEDIQPADKDMTPKAASAFTAYVSLGVERSLEKLADAEPALNVTQLKRWSKNYGWQERLRRIADIQLAAANDRRLQIWLRTIGVYDARTQQDVIDTLSLGDVHSIHDRVRPTEAGGGPVSGTSVVVVVSERPDGPQ